jgi:cell division protein ZapA (FtsZ GTPase activity inhibitor)
MGHVTVTLNGRAYRLRCDDGEERRLVALADHVRGKVEALVSEFGQVGDDRLLAMAALLVADEYFDACERMGEPLPAGSLIGSASRTRRQRALDGQERDTQGPPLSGAEAKVSVA